MLDRKNPQIAINTIELEAGESYSLAADNFMIAFSAETRKGKILDYDPRYVRWISKTVVLQDGNKTESFYPVHVCSDEELEKFYPAQSEDAGSFFDQVHASGNLFCLHDDVMRFSLHGSTNEGTSTNYMEV